MIDILVLQDGGFWIVYRNAMENVTEASHTQQRGNTNRTSEQSLVPRPHGLGMRLPRAELAAMWQVLLRVQRVA